MSSTWEKEADALHSSGARHALILTQANDARGQIAEALARALAPRQIHVSSAGAVPGRLDPLAARVLAELSVTVTGTPAETVGEVDPADVQAIVVLSEEDPTPPALRGVLRVHWPMPDPAAGGGSDKERLARYRALRNELRRRLIRVFAREAVTPAATAIASTSIGPASGGDVDGVKAMLGAALLPSRDVGHPGQRFIVARQNGRLLGCAGLEVAGEDAAVRSMAVHWTRRNAGLGTQLHERLLFEAVLAGVHTLYVVTTTAEEFFARHGYRKIEADQVPPRLLASEEFAAFVPGGGVIMSRAVTAG